MKIIISILLVGIVLGLFLFLFACLKISSRCSREEERRDAYTYTRRNIKRKKN